MQENFEALDSRFENLFPEYDKVLNKPKENEELSKKIAENNRMKVFHSVWIFLPTRLCLQTL